MRFNDSLTLGVKFYFLPFNLSLLGFESLDFVFERLNFCRIGTVILRMVLIKVKFDNCKKAYFREKL